MMLNLMMWKLGLMSKCCCLSWSSHNFCGVLQGVWRHYLSNIERIFVIFSYLNIPRIHLGIAKYFVRQISFLRIVVLGSQILHGRHKSSHSEFLSLHERKDSVWSSDNLKSMQKENCLWQSLNSGLIFCRCSTLNDWWAMGLNCKAQNNSYHTNNATKKNGFVN